MKKVLASAASILFAVFSIAILGLLMSLTFGALGLLFPGNFTNQIWGLVLFDIAAMIWGIVFVFKCESTAQYAIAAIGFIAAFLGTLGMVAVDVMLGGQKFVEVESWVGEWLVYGYVIMTALHSALLYAHHATAPDISEKINVGVARGEIVTEAIKQATHSLDVEKNVLAETITQDIISQVKRDLGLYSVAGTPFERKQQAIEQGKLTDERDPFAYCRPPHGDRQHPDLLFARIPNAMQISDEWKAYDNARLQSIQQDKPTAAPSPFPESEN